MKRALLPACWLVVTCMATARVDADLHITEILASNRSIIQDEDGDFSDYFEVYNDGPDAVNMSGWYATDDPGNLVKWAFPPVVIEPGRFLLVFASNKDRRNASSELHANFQLNITGEFLALVAPGPEVVSFYAPFPGQVEDISYGLRQNATFSNLIPSGAPARAFVPPNGNLGRTWTQIGFNDNSWTAGATGVGYDNNPDYRSLIDLDLESDMDGVNTTAYIRVPFNVPDASALTSLVLRMKYDDGFVAYLNGVEVASRNAPESPTWDSEASGQHDDGSAVVFEDFQLASFVDLLVDGLNVLAIHGLNDNIGSSDFLCLPELDTATAGSLDPDVKEYFLTPTPGFGNVAGYPGVSERPVFSRQSGLITSSFSLTLSVASPSTVIRYTTNGAEPTASSPAYSSPISITGTTMVRARGFEPVLGPSPIVTHTYLRISSDAQTFSSNLPIILVDTFGGGINANNYQLVFSAFLDGEARTRMTDPPQFAGRGGIKHRGSSSLGFAKKNFAFETWDETNNDLDVSLLGFPAQSDWVLHGPYSDKSLMRNYLTYKWSNDIGRYAVRSQFVELFVNSGGGNLSMGDYWGVYVFMEKIKRDKARVNVEKLTASIASEPDISGGYILKKDRADPGDSGFRTSRNYELRYVYPKEANITPAQAAWIKGYLDEFESVLYGANFTHPTNGYARYIDVDSFIDHHILVELAKNIDGYRLSTFYFKRRNEKLNMGPIWDYNLSLGNANYLRGEFTDGWYYEDVGSGDYLWFPRLFQDSNFVQRYTDRYTEIRRRYLSSTSMRLDVDVAGSLLGEAAARNFNRWNILGVYIWPNAFIANTWQEELNWMKGWINGRVNWIDNNFTGPPVFSRNGGPITPGVDLTMTAPSGGTIYYTLNGRDPRRSGGSVEPTANTYGGAITLTENTRVIARALRGGTGWSAPTDETYVVDMPPLVITEIMYHPMNPPAASPYDPDDFEFIEMKNVGSQPLDLAGFRLADGVDFEFTGGTLDPGEHVVVVKLLEAFQTRYSTAGMFIAGEYAGNLENSSETVALAGPVNEPIHAFDYVDTWYPTTDGGGRSLVIIDPFDDLATWGDAGSWRASTDLHGSPGADDGGPDLGGRQLVGDSNQDGSLDLADAVSYLRRMFGGVALALPCDGASMSDGGNLAVFDIDNNFEVNLTDTIFLLNFLFRRGEAPAAGLGCQRIVGCDSTCFR